MLDFYLIKDEQSKPNYPEHVGLEYVFGLDSRTFDNLVKKEIIDARFDYYSDFRWSKELVEQINSKVVKIKNSGSDIDKLNVILKKAMESKSGVIAYCD